MKFNIGKKERGVQFGMGAIQIYCDEMDCDVEGLNHILNPQGKRLFEAIGKIIFAGLSNYCNLNDEIIDFNVVQVQSWIDELPQEDYNAIMDVFKNSKMFGKSIQEHFDSVNVASEGEETDKKKV
jgi:hypothetical protein